MMADENFFPVTLWYSTLGMGDGHDYATRGYLRALMQVGFSGLRIPPSISTSVLMLDEEADPDITQFASLTRPPVEMRMKPMTLIKAGDPRIGTTKVIPGTDMRGESKPMEVKITEGSIDLDVEQEYMSKEVQEVRSVVIHHDPASIARHFTTLTKQGRPDKVGYVGVTVWETSHIPEAVAVILNELNGLVVPSEHTQQAFLASGVDIDIDVVRHTFDPKRWSEPTEAELERPKGREKYVFYAIATPIERKNLRGLIRAYFKAFEGRQDVILRVKTSGQKAEIAEVAKQALEESGINAGRRPPFKVFSGNWATEKIRAFHLDGDCYVSACRAEGFGLCELEAKLCGSRVITSEWGAAKEFIEYQEVTHLDPMTGNPYRAPIGHEATTGQDVLVPCKLIDVDNMYGIGCYETDQQWADPDEDALVAAMRRAARERLGPDREAWGRLRRELAYEKIGAELGAVILRAREAAEEESGNDF